MDRQLVLEDKNGEVVRTYAWSGKPVKVIRRGDNFRLELVSDISKLGIPYEFLVSLMKRN